MNTSQDKFNLHFSIPSMSSPIHVEFVENITISTLYIYFETSVDGGTTSISPSVPFEITENGTYNEFWCGSISFIS